MDENKPRARRRKRTSGAPDPFRVAGEADPASSRRSSNPGPPPSSRKLGRSARSSIPGAPPSGRGSIKPYVPGAPLSVPRPAIPPPEAPASADAATPPSTDAPNLTSDAAAPAPEVKESGKSAPPSPWKLPRIIGAGGGFALAVAGLVWLTSTGSTPGSPGGVASQPSPAVIELSPNEAALKPRAAAAPAPVEPAPPAAPAPVESAAPRALEPTPPEEKLAEEPRPASSSEAKDAKDAKDAKNAAAETDAKGKPTKVKPPAKPDPKSAAAKPSATPTAAPSQAPAADPSKPAFTFQFQ